MTAVNAFNWKEYTDEERAKRGDPFKQMKHGATISKRTSVAVERIRETKPSHGTVYGVTSKILQPRSPNMINPNAKRKSS
jgi:hypothetical protein